MKTKIYLVRLTPYEKFFFGGENTFGDSQKASYLVKSNYFPQQTGVLGFVRYQLLLQSNNGIFRNNRIVNEDGAKKLIGPSGFNVKGNNDFGKIKCLSPVFLHYKNKKDEQSINYFPANREYMDIQKLDDNCCKIEGTEHLDLMLEKGIPILKTNEDKPYDPKMDLPDLLLGENGELKKYDEVFKEYKQVGIRKNYKGITEDDAYYVQTFYQLAEGFSFAFLVELEEGVNFSTQEIAVFGGEQQAFKIEVEKLSDVDEEENEPCQTLSNIYSGYLPEYKPSKNYDKLVLLSDVYVDNDDEIFRNTVFAITETVPFRFIVSSTKAKHNYYTKPQKTKRYTLFKKGSVFYVKDGQLNIVKDKFDNMKNFRKIGYNYYAIIPKNNKS